MGGETDVSVVSKHRLIVAWIYGAQGKSGEDCWCQAPGGDS